LLKLHNIDKKLLEKCAISSEELIYLIQSSNATELYYQISGQKKIALTQYCKNLISNKKVQKAWKEIIKGKLLTESNFTDAVDKYIESMKDNKKQGSRI